MANMHFYAKLIVDMLRKMLGRIYTAMLTARATETELQGGESSLDITTYMMVCQRIDMIQELQYLPVNFLYGSYLPGLWVLRQSKT